jgi:hypothetical protein
MVLQSETVSEELSSGTLLFTVTDNVVRRNEIKLPDASLLFTTILILYVL